ncbi:MAG: DUF6531 domain-containing protein, partial [Dehalococcoidia bacterium]
GQPDPAAASGPATITAPVNGSTLAGSSITVSWTPGANTSAYVLWLGSSAAGSDLFSSPITTATSMTAGGIPSNGRPLYARLWSYDTRSTSWLASDAAYTAAAAPAGLAVLTSPIAGATLAGASQSFTWTPGSGVRGYQLVVGSSFGAADYFSSSLLSSSTTSVTATGLPTDGRPVYVRLLTLNGSSLTVDYGFTAAGSGGARPGPVSLALPSAGQPNLTTTPTLMWSAPTGAITGITSYTVQLYSSGGSPSAASFGSALPATTALLEQVPASAGLQPGTSYYWTVVACNGTACTTAGTGSPLGSWWAFSVAQAGFGSAPGSVAQVAPADGSQNLGTTPSLSWVAPSGAISGVTLYTVLLHDAPGGGGNALAPLPATSALSQAVPAPLALLANQSYSWNVLACTGLYCSTLSATWRTFATGTARVPGTVAQQRPADSALNTGTAPTLSWLAPTGAIPGTTTYTVSLWNPLPAPSGTLLAPLPATTSLSLTVPVSAGLVNGASYHWNVIACTGGRCSGFANHWFAFSTAPAPGVVSLIGPANNAGDQTLTPQLSWSTPTSFIPGVTQVYLTLWNPYAPPLGARLGDVHCGSCATTGQAPLAEGLLYGQRYQWNVYACNGEACSGYAPGWGTFSTMTQPPATSAGVAPNLLQADFGGLGKGGGTVATVNLPPATLSGVAPNLLQADFGGLGTGWSGDGVYTALSDGSSYRNGVTSLTSGAVDLNFGGGSGAALRLGYLPGSQTTQQCTYDSGGYECTTVVSPAPVTVQYNGTQVFSVTASSFGWAEAVFAVPASLGSGGSFTISAGGTGAAIAYLQPLGLPSGFNLPRLSGDSRLPKAVGATDGGGVDVVTGATGSAHTDLALPGLAGTLAFSRAYATAALTETVSGPAGLSVGPLGPRWTDNWQYAVWFPDASTVALQVPGGQTFSFYLGPSGYVSQAGADASFSQDNQSGTHYTLTTAAQVRYGFSWSNGGWLLTTVTDRNQNTTTLSYDSANRLTTVTDAGGRFFSLGYSGSGSAITSVSDSAGRTVRYGYDPTYGDLTSVTDVLGGVTGYGYTAGTHLLTQITDPLHSVVLRNSYDPGGSGKVITQTDAGGQTVGFSYGYPGAGATTVTDQRGHLYTYYFDAAWRITDVLDAYGNRVSNSYDSDNNKASIENQLGGVLTSTFDANGNLLTLTDALNDSWHFSYDPHNNRLSATDPLNHLTRYTYDARGNLLTTTDPLNETTTFTVNGLGQVTGVQDPRGYSGSFGYDSFGDRTTATDPLNHTSTAVYDSAGRVTATTDALNHTVSATYNAANEVLTGSVSPSTGVTSTASTTYDLDGRPLTVTDPNNHATTYAYDVRGLLSTVTDANTPAGVTTYGYDAAGNRTSVTDAKNQTTSYTFDNDNRPLTVTDPLSTVLYTFTYDAAGRRATKTDGKNQTTTYSYTLRDQLDHVTYPDTSTVQYQYDQLGNRSSMADGTGTTTYAYDALDRATSVTTPGSKTVGY